METREFMGMVGMGRGLEFVGYSCEAYDKTRGFWQVCGFQHTKSEGTRGSPSRREDPPVRLAKLRAA